MGKIEGSIKIAKNQLIIMILINALDKKSTIANTRKVSFLHLLEDFYEIFVFNFCHKSI